MVDRLDQPAYGPPDEETLKEIGEEFHQVLRLGAPPPPRPEGYTDAEMELAATRTAQTIASQLVSERKRRKNAKKTAKKKAAAGGAKAVDVSEDVSDVQDWKAKTGFDDSDDPLAALGMSITNAAGRTKLRNLQRLCHLVGSTRGIADEEETVSKKLEKLVCTGDQVSTITEARANVAALVWCAGLMHEDVCHLLNHPEDRTISFNKEKADVLSRDLQKLLLELEARAGQPEELKSERAERMREKMEKKLLPNLKKEIPRQAERLRFMLQDVVHYLEAEPMLVEEPEPTPEPAPPKPEFKEWETKDEDQPEVSEEEKRLLESMGWCRS